MNVVVKKKRWTMYGSQYIVSVDGQKKYLIERVGYTFKPEYEIKDYHTWKILGTIKSKKNFKADAIIKIDTDEYDFNQVGWNLMTYRCRSTDSNTEYLIQGNKGYNVSVFKGEEQVGYWKKRSFEILSGKRYDAVQNYDEDPILLSAFIILIGNYRISVKLGGDTGWDIGNMGKELTDFDDTWKAKEHL